MGRVSDATSRVGRTAATVGAVSVVCSGCGLLGLGDDPEVPGAVKEFVRAKAPVGASRCDVVGETVRLATAADPFGGDDFEWWSAETAGGGMSDVVLQLDDDGNSTSAAGGRCGNEPSQGQADGLWWSGPSGTDDYVVHGGHAPDGAVAARLTFGDQEPVTVEANARGYFLVVIPERACCEWLFPDRIEALDGDGEVVAAK